MAFGQAAGPPAGSRQIQELAELLEQHGFTSFREARHPLGLTQRQAGGKFTVDEVTELIERLGDPDEAGPDETDSPVTSATPGRTAAARPEPATPRRSSGAMQRAAKRAVERQEEAVLTMSAEVMATELSNRGWCCIPPPAES